MDQNNFNELERRALIFNVQKYNVYDGPGIRTIVFFKGCPLKCKWCANPEGLNFYPEIMYKESLCTNCGLCVAANPSGVHYFDTTGQHQVCREKMRTATFKDEVACCPTNALQVTGEWKTIPELMQIIHEDDSFYEMSGGGVTLSGGECTMQSQAVIALLKACKEDGLHTAIETCGHCATKTFLEIAEYVDLFLYDMKHMDSKRHNELTGVSNERVLANLTEILNLNYNVKIRMPMLKEINDSKAEIQQIMDFLLPYRDYPNFQGIDLLPYHKLGVNKYAQLGMEYPIAGDPSLGEEDLDRIEQWLTEYEFPVSVIRH